MTEKIIINPNKVRGCGNIVNVHTSTDYELSDCTITETTDTVNGAETIIYEMEDTILFYDSGVTPTNNTYADNELKHTITATMSNSRTALRLGATDDIIEFKNFIVWSL